MRCFLQTAMGPAAIGLAALSLAACSEAAPAADERDRNGDASILTGAEEVAKGGSVSVANPAAEGDASQRPARTPKMDWVFRINEDERSRPALLAFEQPDTDNQPLVFTCEEGGERVFATALTSMATVSELTLTAGAVTRDIPGKSELSDMDDLYIFQSVEIPANSPLMDAFAATGWLSFATYRASTDAVGTASGDKAVKDFIAHCRGR